MQYQSDIINKPVTVRERDTCWGVAKGVLTSYDLEFEGFKDEATSTYTPNKKLHCDFYKKYQQWCSERIKFYNWKEE